MRPRDDFNVNENSQDYFLGILKFFTDRIMAEIINWIKFFRQIQLCEFLQL